ncbi:MAG: SoxR reducing system RseC family protein [Fusobacteriaceae bacterium]|jgi:sigma-E factor negative regulatory protein RseC|nr:SoxR reducing system RseC family protein [Fusobacteriaceae bacterium]
MESKGVVIDIKEKGINVNEIKIRLYKETACAHCDSCSHETKFAREYTLTSDRQVKLGDTITLEVSGHTIIKSSLILYAFPVILLFFGYYVGAQLLKFSENQSIAMSFIFLIVSFLFIFIYDRVFQKKNENDDIKIIAIERQ